MSKSVGNSLLVREVVKRVRPIELRYYLGAPHYRSVIEFSDAALDEAATSFQRIEGFVAPRRRGDVGAVEPAAELPTDFVAAMDDDLGTPAALAVLHDTVRDGNKLVADGDSPACGRRWPPCAGCSASSGWTRWRSRGPRGPRAATSSPRWWTGW